MTFRPSLPWLLLTLAVALIALYIAAGAFQKTESAIAAAVFSVALCVTALRSNMPLWNRSADAPGNAITPREAMAGNVLLIAVAFLWCALSFYAVYLGTEVRWQHGWEYGTACAVFAAAYAYYRMRLSDPRDDLTQKSALDRMARLAGYQALLLAIGLVWLIGAGKLITHKGDWVANDLFIGGGVAILCISLVLIKTNAALNNRVAATS